MLLILKFLVALSSSSPLETHEEGLKTSVGNCIKKLLGSDANLVEFDRLRFKLKQAKRAGNHMKSTSVSRYKHITASIKSRVISVKYQSEAELKEMEQKQNGKLPTKTPGTPYHNLLKQRNLAITIVRNI